jgi:SAM-dependent methyltransferase
MTQELYEDYYAAASDRFVAWRALGARRKGEHIARLLSGQPAPSSVIEVGCGDGALLEDLSQRGIGDRLVGYEIAQSAVDRVRSRGIPRLDRAELFDGEHVPEPAGSFDLAVLSHVLEHTEHPEVVLREVARIARLIAIEVPLEDVLASRRESYRRNAAKIGHIQQFDREAVYRLASQANLGVKREFFIRQSLEDRMFWADTWRQKAKALAGWAARRGLDTIAPKLSRRLLVVNYACLCSTQAQANDGSVHRPSAV